MFGATPWIGACLPCLPGLRWPHSATASRVVVKTNRHRRQPLRHRWPGPTAQRPKPRSPRAPPPLPRRQSFPARHLRPTLRLLPSPSSGNLSSSGPNLKKSDAASWRDSTALTLTVPLALPLAKLTSFLCRLRLPKRPIKTRCARMLHHLLRRRPRPHRRQPATRCGKLSASREFLRHRPTPRDPLPANQFPRVLLLARIISHPAAVLLPLLATRHCPVFL